VVKNHQAGPARGQGMGAPNALRGFRVALCRWPMGSLERAGEQLCSCPPSFPAGTGGSVG
jgi:hypothetical protein